MFTPEAVLATRLISMFPLAGITVNYVSPGKIINTAGRWISLFIARARRAPLIFPLGSLRARENARVFTPGVGVESGLRNYPLLATCPRSIVSAA
jgi:hypothetical protein